MMQTMLLTGLTPLSSKTEINSWENRPFKTVWPEQILQKPNQFKDVNRTIRKRRKRVRTAFTTEQLRGLERAFSSYRYISSESRRELARSLDIDDKCVKIWFQNRRMKEKRESLESSCDSSSVSSGSETHALHNSPGFEAQLHPEVQPETEVQPKTEIQPETSKTEYRFHHANHSEYPYQLSTYYGAPQNVYEMPPTNVPVFYNDNNNVYPTQYYPTGIHYPQAEDNGANSNYGNDMHQYWAANHNSYYSPI